VVTRGEVWWYDDPVAGRRPHLILTRPEAIPVLNQVVGVPLTRTIRGIPTEVALDRSDGMRVACALALDNLTQIRPALCTEHIATLGPERMAQVCQALRVSLVC
jgi:mRNA interferase MazF